MPLVLKAALFEVVFCPRALCIHGIRARAAIDDSAAALPTLLHFLCLAVAMQFPHIYAISSLFRLRYGSRLSASCYHG